MEPAQEPRIDVELVYDWIDKQLLGELPNVIGEPGDKITIIQTNLGLACVCKNGTYLIATHERVRIDTAGDA